MLVRTADGRRRSMVLRWAPVVAYMALIYYQSSQTVPSLATALPDKLAHLIGYGGLGLLVARAVAGGWPARLSLRDVLLIMVISVCYGASDELHQATVPGRTSDIADLYADAAGAAIAVAVSWACGILWVRSGRSESPRHEL